MTKKKKTKKKASKARKAAKKAPRKAAKKAPRKAAKKVAKKAAGPSTSARLKRVHRDVLKTIEHVRKSDRKILAELRRAIDHADASAKTR